MKRRIKDFLSADHGSTTIEFVIMFPMVIMLFASAFEAGVLATRQAMLERATNQSVRALRVNPTSPPTYEELKASICDAAVIFPDCTNAIHIELRQIDTETWDLQLPWVACRDRDNDYTPDIAYNTGGSDELMLVRVCAVFEPIFPTAGLGATLTRVNESDYALVATSLYVNEPR